MPGGTSSDPVKRERSRRNLVPGGGRPASLEHRPALRHGGYARVARERLEAKQLEVFDAISADAPLRGADGGLPVHDAAVVRLLAECLCRLEDVSANVRDFGLLDSETGAVRPAVDLERRLRQEAADYLDALGMTPRARARLGLDLQRGFDLARALAELPDDDGGDLDGGEDGR